MGSRKRIAGVGLPDDCCEYVISKLLNENDGVEDRSHYLETLSLVSKQFLYISNRFVYSLTLIYDSSPLYRLFKRFPNLTSLDLSCFRGDLNTLLSQIPRSVSLTSLNLSNHPTFPALGLRTILKTTTISSTLTSLTCSKIGSLYHTDISFIAHSFPFLQQLDISFPKTITGNGYDTYTYNNALKLLTQKLSKLRKVNLSGHFYVNDSSFFQLCINCVFLQEVVMFQCHFLTRAGLASAICQRPTLNSFSLTIRKDVTSYFIHSLLTLKGLTCLDFSFSLITDELLCFLALEALPLRNLVLHKCFGYTYTGLSYLLSRCRSLQHLDLQNADFLNVQSFIDLCVFLGDLVSINVNGCDKLNNAALFALLKNCPLLTEIHMESTELGIGSRPSVVDLAVYHQVKSLHLAYNPYLQDEDITMFSFMFPNMQLLDLSSCDDICIVKVLKRCCNIRHLKFAFCPQPKLPWTNLKASKLEVLDLSNSRIDGKALHAVSKICPRLLQLDLEYCYHVTEKGVRLVVENCIHLREINLRSCPKVSTKIVSWMIFSRPSLRKITAPPQFRPRDCDRKLLFGRCLVC